MTTLACTFIALSLLLAFLCGRYAVMASDRLRRNRRLRADIARLENRLDYIADSSQYDRFYEIEQNDARDAYNVMMRVYVHNITPDDDSIETISFCLVKSFPFGDDKDYALRQAEELIDKLNETI